MLKQFSNMRREKSMIIETRRFVEYFNGRLTERVKSDKYEVGDLYYYFNQLVNVSPIDFLWEVNTEEDLRREIEYCQEREKLFVQICENRGCLEKLEGEKYLFEKRPYIVTHHVENYTLTELKNESLEELIKDAKKRAQRIFDRKAGLNSFQ